MTAVTARSLQEERVTVGPDVIERLDERLRGRLLTEGDEGYEEARTLWNAMIDKRPALIAQCSGVADVQAAVTFARDQDLLLSVRGGGHNVAGRAVCEGGLMIDLSPMNGVRVDPTARTARVGGGAVMGDLDHEAQTFGLATTGGIVSTTGVAGLALGGGLGYLARRYGLVHDNLRSVDVVTADGEWIRASEARHADLFWGIRGGGGNFGVATSFEFELYELGPEIFRVQLLYPFDAVPGVLRFYRDFMADAPREVQVYAGLLQAAPHLGVPEPLHGETLLAVGGVYAGDIEDGKEAFRPLREFGDPIADLTQVLPYKVRQQELDALYREGHRNYWKSDFYDMLPNGFIDAVMEHGEALPSPHSTVFWEWMGGKIAEPAPDVTAFGHREAAFSFTVAPKWADPGRDDEMIGWARAFHEAVRPYASDGVYVNYLDRDESDRVRSAFGDRYERLVELKDRWDPDNLFRMNQNIEPTG